MKKEVGFDPDTNLFYYNGKYICSLCYDKKQNLYITKHVHKNYKKGFKFLYSKSPEGIRRKIEKTINNT